MKPRTAAKYLDLSYDSVMKLIGQEVFTVQDNGKRGRGRHIHLLTEELDIYADHGADAVREHRAKKRKAKR